MAHMVIFGPGYTASQIGAAVQDAGVMVETIDRAMIGDAAAVAAAVGRATHILSSVPPAGEDDPVLVHHGPLLAACSAEWIGYLSSTGVYGDTGGAWVDENAPIGTGRRVARVAADIAWQRLHCQARVFRLPGIYGPGRSPLDRVRGGTAHRVDMPGHAFSRIHVDDIVGGTIASMRNGPPGVYNLADDLPAPQSRVVELACDLLGRQAPRLLGLDEAGLPPAARAFYAENRRVANCRAKRLLGWQPRYPDYRSGLRSIFAAEGGR